MEYILLIILIIVVIITLYVFYEMSNNITYGFYEDTIYGLMDLNKPPIEVISATSLANPASSRYAIGAWININSWNTTDYKMLITKTPFTTTGDIFSDVNSKADFCIYLDKIQPNLICKFTSIQTGIPIKPIILMSGFPLQTWTYVILSVNNQIVDAYINGKLVLSHKLESLPQNTNSGIFFGNNLPLDIQINKFERWETSIGPETAWGSFLNTRQ